MSNPTKWFHGRAGIMGTYTLCLLVVVSLLLMVGCSKESANDIPTAPGTENAIPGKPMAHPWPVARQNIANTGATASTFSGLPSVKWSLPLGTFGGVSLVVEYGYIYHMDSDVSPNVHILQCRDLLNGEEVWSVRFATILPNLSLTVAEGKVLVQFSNNMNAYDAFSGEQLWAVQLSDYRSEVFSHGVIDDGAVYVSLIGTSEPKSIPGRLARYDLKTGSLVWESVLDDFPVGMSDGISRVHTSRFPVVDSERVYLSLRDFDDKDFGRGSVLAVDKNTGSVVWSTSFTQKSTIDSLMEFDAPVLSEQNLYVTYYVITGAGNSILYVRRYDKKDGANTWTYASEPALWPGQWLSYLEGGTTLAADKIYILYNLTTSKEIQILDLGGATGGNFRLGDGTDWTDDIAYNAGAGTIQEELETLYEKGDVVVLADRDFIIAFAADVGGSRLIADFSGLAGATGPSLLYSNKTTDWRVNTIDAQSGKELFSRAVLSSSSTYLGLFIQAGDIHLLAVQERNVPGLAGFEALSGERSWFVPLEKSGDTAWAPAGAMAGGRLALLVNSVNGWMLYCFE